MKYIISIFSILFVFNTSFSQKAEATVEAEFDTLFNFQFDPLINTHTKRILIDKSHNTIYSKDYGQQSAREMLRIMSADGFKIQYTDQDLTSSVLNDSTSDILIIHGMPNDEIELSTEDKDEVLYKSPMSTEEVVNVAMYVYKGGSLFLFLSHAPGGSGALPLLEAFNVKFRDGYAGHASYPGYKNGICGHFNMTSENNMLNLNHAIFNSKRSSDAMPETVKYLCGAAIFRYPEDNILSFPENTINYSRSSNGKLEIQEVSNSYAGMIGFEYGSGRVVICTDQGIFRSLDLLLDGEKVPVTIHDPKCDNAELLLSCIRWLGKLQ